MLEVVDELERNGQNLQHFSRELSRYFRNLLVARVAGADTRLVAASAAQREKLAAIAAQFSEEDLTRYLQLSLDLFSDLQASLQPRFHLEIGLVRLVHAGRLLPIEQALAGIKPNAPAASAPRSAPVAAAPSPAPKPALNKSSPFELDRAKKAGAQPVLAEPETGPEPMANGEWRQQLHGALMELGLPFTADAVENSRVIESNGELQFITSAAYKLALRPDDLNKALQRISPKPYRIKVTVGDAGAQGAPLPAAPVATATEDDATGRALANPEVQRFREVFGGEIRKVRNLKE